MVLDQRALCPLEALPLQNDVVTQTIEIQGTSIAWCVYKQLAPYDATVRWMEKRARDVADGNALPWIGVLQHPPVYTMGTGGSVLHKNIGGIPVVQTARGGKMTYHGPGVWIIYMALPLDRLCLTVDLLTHKLGLWLVRVLAECGLKAFFNKERVGVWTVSPLSSQAKKIASIGLRVRRNVVYHGVALNVDPDLQAFKKIQTCGEKKMRITSLHAEGISVATDKLHRALQVLFTSTFGCKNI